MVRGPPCSPLNGLSLLFLFSVNLWVSCPVPSPNTLHLFTPRAEEAALGCVRTECSGCAAALCARGSASPHPPRSSARSPARSRLGLRLGLQLRWLGLQASPGRVGGFRWGLGAQSSALSPGERCPEVGNQLLLRGRVEGVAKIHLQGRGLPSHHQVLQEGGRLSPQPCFLPTDQLCLPPCPLTFAWLSWGGVLGRGAPSRSATGRW